MNCILSTLLATSVALATPALAGDLSPPAGPVAPVMKTLDQVEPRIPIGPDTTPGDEGAVYRLPFSGHYYLTDNVISEAGKVGIEINSAATTIDLSGYVVGGQPGALEGIKVIALSAGSITIRNGFVGGVGAAGIDISIASDCLIENVQVVFCTGDGIVTGTNATIRGCLVSNVQNGIVAGAGSIVEECLAFDNAGDGFQVEASRILQCIARANGGDGIDCGSGSVAQECTTANNAGSGIAATDRCQIDRCLALANGVHGICIGSFNSIRANVGSQNSPGGGSGAGVWANGNENWIEGNLVQSNDYGIWVSTDARNVIVRNAGSDNALNNFFISAGNSRGQIELLGSGSEITTSNPWANFSF